MRLTRPHRVFGTLIAAASFAAPALADSVSLVSNRDNTLYETAAGSTSNGAGNFLFAGRNSQSTNSIRRGLLAFDLSSIPAGSTINSVTLTLHQDSTNPANSSVSLHRLLEGWGEGTSSGLGNGAPATTGDATWLHRAFNTSLWTTRVAPLSPLPPPPPSSGAMASTPGRAPRSWRTFKPFSRIQAPTSVGSSVATKSPPVPPSVFILGRKLIPRFDRI